MGKAMFKLKPISTVLLAALPVLLWVGLISPHHEPDYVGSVEWSPDGKWIAISGGEIGCDQTDTRGFAVRIFSAATGQTAKRLMGMTCTSVGLDWSPDGSKLVSFNSAQSVAYIWDVASEKLLLTKPLNVMGMSSVEWSPKGDLIASGTPGNSILLWDSVTGEIVSSIPGTTADWGPDGSKLATGTIYGSSVDIRDAQTGEVLTIFTGATDVIYSVRWSLDGSKILAVSADNKVLVWEVSTQKLILTLPVAKLSNAQWSPDAQQIATASLDGVIRVWDTHTGKLLATFSGTEALLTVGWSPDGSQLAFAERDGVLHIVDAPEGTKK